MNCPNCQETLLMTVRNNVEIDYCPKCRGIWLDRGELDKLLSQESSKSTYVKDHESFKPEYRDQHSYRTGHGYPKKKKSFLEDLFDF